MLRTLATASATRSTTTLASTISTLTVVGSGIMGSGIAQVNAVAGNSVHLVDISEEALDGAKNAITASLARVYKREPEPEPLIEAALGQITFTTDMASAVAESDLLVEAVSENMMLKKSIFSAADAAAPDHTIFATNTSSLSVAEIGANIRPDRFCGIHYFNPPPMMPLVELIATDATDPAVMDSVQAHITAIGKTPVLCGDTPGFIVNRLLVPYLQDAVAMLERGDADRDSIDTAMRFGAGMPMGPFQLLDTIGLDTAHSIIDSWARAHGDTFDASPLLEKMVAEGKLGRKSGEGFYKYD